MRFDGKIERVDGKGELWVCECPECEEWAAYELSTLDGIYAFACENSEHIIQRMAWLAEDDDWWKHTDN